MSQAWAILQQILAQLPALIAGQPVTLKFGPETIDVEGKKIELTETITAQLVP